VQILIIESRSEKKAGGKGKRKTFDYKVLINSNGCLLKIAHLPAIRKLIVASK